MTLDVSHSRLLVAAPLRVEVWALRPGLDGCGVMRTGMGSARSQRAARRILEAPAKRVAVAGLCGALTPDFAPGDVVVASSLLGGDECFPTLESGSLRESLAHVGIEARVGPLLSVDHVVRGAERSQLADSGALVVDMESAWLAAGAGGRPLAVLRVVLDAPGREIVRPGVLRDLGIALRRLRSAAPALAAWAAPLQTDRSAALH